MVKREVVYFDSWGPQNTDSVLEISKKYASEEGVEDIVVASASGATGTKASKIFKGRNVVVVTHYFGRLGPGKDELDAEKRRQILANGAKILTATHGLSGVERAIRNVFGTALPVEIVAEALKIFGAGTKVCVEIALMAADAGLIPTTKDVICIAGTSKGCDTALLLRPANSHNFFHLQVKEIIAKPRAIKPRPAKK